MTVAAGLDMLAPLIIPSLETLKFISTCVRTYSMVHQRKGSFPISSENLNTSLKKRKVLSCTLNWVQRKGIRPAKTTFYQVTSVRI